jgi:hypothetical protein
MGRLIARVFPCHDMGGELLEHLEMPHPLHDPNPKAILKLFEKSKLFDVHPKTIWGRGKTTDGWNFLASVYTAENDGGLARCGSAAYRIGCRQKVD